MNCEQFHKYKYEYVYDEISFFVKAQLDEHIASCPKCREEVELLTKIRDTLYSMPQVEVDESFKAGIYEKLDAMAAAEAEEKKSKKKKRSFLRDWRTYSALAACLVLAVVVQSRVGDFYRNTSNPGQIESGDLGNIDLTGMQETTNSDVTFEPIESTEPVLEAENDIALASETEQVQNTAPTALPAAKPQTTETPAVQPRDNSQPVSYAGTEDTPSEAAYRAAGDNTQGADTPTPAKTNESANNTPVVGAPSPQSSVAFWDWSSEKEVDTEPTAEPAPAGGTVSVAADQVSKARQIANKYGTVQGNTVEMTRSSLNNYLRTLEKNDIEYSQNIPGGDVVVVEIVAK